MSKHLDRAPSAAGSDRAVPAERPSRRLFLGGLGASALLLASGCRPVVPDPTAALVGEPSSDPGSPQPSPVASAAAPVAADPFTRAAWQPLLGQTLTLAGTATVVAVLTTVDDLTGAAAGADRSFGLSMRVALDEPVLHRVEEVRLPDGTTRHLDLFPIDRGARYQWYQAVVHNPT